LLLFLLRFGAACSQGLRTLLNKCSE